MHWLDGNPVQNYHRKTIYYKLSKKKDFGLSSRMMKNSSGGIYVIFRGFNFSSDTEISSKDFFEMASSLNQTHLKTRWMQNEKNG